MQEIPVTYGGQNHPTPAITPGPLSGAVTELGAGSTGAAPGAGSGDVQAASPVWANPPLPTLAWQPPLWHYRAAGAGRAVGSVSHPRCHRLLAPARGPGGSVPAAATRPCTEQPRGRAQAAACPPKRGICELELGRGQHGGCCGNLCPVPGETGQGGPQMLSERGGEQKH